MTSVLVTDGENRAALAVTRSLGRKGCRVVVGGRAKNISSASKYCTRAYHLPSPMADEQQYLDRVLKVVRDENVEIVFPMTEPAVHILSRNSHEFPEGVLIAAPEWDKIVITFNKVEVFRRAEDLGVGIPSTVFVRDREDFFTKEHLFTNFPVVVKPGMSRIHTGSGFISAKVAYANSAEELKVCYEKNDALNYPSMIQEKIIGPGTGLFTLFDRDRHLALFSHRRLREKPPSGGVSVVSESIPLDPEMVDASARLLSSIGWTGVAMVEFKRDIRDGRPKLMEINGRFWGSLQLAIACGVDFPALLLDYLRGEKPDVVIGEYKTGHKLKWFLGTLDHLIIRLKNDDSSLNLPPGSPSKFCCFLDFLKVWERDTSFDVIDRDDIRPFIRELKGYFRNMD
ncbi:MAG TPA: ATP-grasp domain-containing protein [Deltaproteobacteria bacterium]|nr:ATP-grasp domain-containing protein [Deltaproteobacteria bacterium]